MKWKPLQEAFIADQDYTAAKFRPMVDAQMATYGQSYDEAIAALRTYDAKCTYWRNDLYQVQVRPFYNDTWQIDMVHLNIRRIDGAPIFDWRHRQYIKNQLVGPECEAFEVYPAESRLVDTSNKYHLWAIVDPKVRIPVGIDYGQGRDVIKDEVKTPSGLRQRREI